MDLADGLETVRPISPGFPRSSALARGWNAFGGVTSRTPQKFGVRAVYTSIYGAHLSAVPSGERSANPAGVPGCSSFP